MAVSHDQHRRVAPAGREKDLHFYLLAVQTLKDNSLKRPPRTCCGHGPPGCQHEVQLCKMNDWI